MYKKFLSFTIIALFSLYAIADGSPAKSPSEEVKPSSSDGSTKSSLEVTSPWARPSMSSSNTSAVYLTITNKSDTQFVLIGASAMDVANNVELHRTYVDTKGISRMSSVDKIVIPANSTIQLKPGGIHIMLFDLKRSLKNNDKFTLTLNFENSTSLTTEVVVGNQQSSD